MSNKVIFITGANGEMGYSLIKSFNDKGINNIIALDIDKPKHNFNVLDFIEGSILNSEILNMISEKYHIDSIFHLAAILSTKAEKNPQLANQVNIDGTKKILDFGKNNALKQNSKILFFFPSSIAVYNVKGNNDVEIKEHEFCSNPMTEYGRAKLHCEKMGNDYEFNNGTAGLDFRSIRFPGIISASSMPTGGTSDYAPEMIHAAANNTLYKCFVSNNRQLPFIVMPDAIDAIFKIVEIPKKNLLKKSYNISSFNPSVESFYRKTKEFFPEFNMTYSIDDKRQAIVDSWPNAVNCEAAKKDWGWLASYDFETAYIDYLIPEIKNKYN